MPIKKYLGVGLFGLFVLLFFLLPSFATVFYGLVVVPGNGARAGVSANVEHACRAGRGDVRSGLWRSVPEYPARAARAAENPVHRARGAGPARDRHRSAAGTALFLLGAAAVAFFVALFASGRWDTWLMARNAVPFGQVDPVLGLDISFYLFQLPLLHFLHALVFFTVLLSALAAGLVYFVSQNISLDPQRGLISERPGASPPERARRHLSARSGVPGVARYSGVLDDSVWDHSRRVVRGCVCDDPRAVGAGRGFRYRRGAAGLAGLCTSSLGYFGRYWAVCRRFRGR